MVVEGGNYEELDVAGASDDVMCGERSLLAYKLVMILGIIDSIRAVSEVVAISDQYSCFKDMQFLFILDRRLWVLYCKKWSGLLGQGTGIYKWKVALGFCSCRSLSLW